MDIANQIKKFSAYANNTFEVAVRIILSVLIIVLLAAMFLMVLKTAFMLDDYQGSSVHEITNIMIVNALLILAVLEVFRTTLTYFSEGRVKVTYIIDTVIVVVLTEVMVFWFKNIEYQRLIMVIALVLALVAARIMTIRFSPAKEEV